MKNFFRKLFRPNTRYYGHVISLGYNCEVAFEFFVHFKFVESSLFTWSYAYSLKDTLTALNHLDAVGSAGFAEPNPLWECKNTHIRFHAQLRDYAKEGVHPEDPVVLAQDLAELAPRVNYLKEKLKRTAQDGKKNLYIVKIKSSSLTAQELAAQLRQLCDALHKLGPNEFDLLVVLEAAFLAELTEQDTKLPNLFIRRVNHFTPEECVTDLNSADTAGWKRLFNQFRPDFSLKRQKHFKFEQTHD